MTQPLINSVSEKTIRLAANNLPQSLLMTGEIGVGLGTVAKYLANLCNIHPVIILPEKDEKIDIDKGTIGVDLIRQVYADTRTKTSSKRMIIIDYAERMTVQAQNAFLKLLEEPGGNTHFLLLSHSANKLLPTILSRVEVIHLRPISDVQSKQLLSDLKVTDSTKIAQMLFMASGRPAELTRLATDETYFNQRSNQVRDARQILRGTNYQKLIVAHQYKDDRQATLGLLLGAANILKISINSNPQPDAISRLDVILDTYQKIDAGGNIRLCLARIIV